MIIKLEVKLSTAILLRKSYIISASDIHKAPINKKVLYEYQTRNSFTKAAVGGLILTMINSL